ncbi:MAG: hypothetical protein COB04_14940 [Gammaproteobacteria bacterium]|nr:MAG: hypothetical protein COB04_14940 [Gammaproteobacteria bacterium]
MKDWENLRYFMSVARQGTLTGAAKELGVSHSTVLRRIEQFERALGTTLFKKLQRGYELSHAGEQLFTNSKGIEGNIDKVLSQVSGQYDVVAGKLRISQPEVGLVNMHPVYAEYARLHPEITFEIYSTIEMHNLSQQEVDIALRFYPVSAAPPDLLVGRCLGAISTRVYASRAYIDGLKKDHTLHDYSWISWMTERGSAEGWLRDNVINPRIVLRTDSVLDVLGAVRNDMGAAILPTHEGDRYPELIPLLNNKIVFDNRLWLLTHRDLRNSERVMSFIRFVGEKLVLE